MQGERRSRRNNRDAGDAGKLDTYGEHANMMERRRVNHVQRALRGTETIILRRGKRRNSCRKRWNSWTKDSADAMKKNAMGWRHGNQGQRTKDGSKFATDVGDGTG